MNNKLHNTTFAVDEPLVDSFLEFMRRDYLPAMTNAGAERCILSRMPSGEGVPPCFAVQHRQAAHVAEAVATVEAGLKAQMTSRWADGVVWFDTCLDVLLETDNGQGR